ncbi:MAG: helix-hairpin-helix domain-containing protein [Pseudomonadota bacterium]|nr:helix-hairpin-helix domain-containing protein [Pseudomonadota bacterium]
MQRFFAVLIATLASLGLAVASTSALAQKAETPKVDAKKVEAPKTEAKKPEMKKADAPKADAKMAAPMDINTASEKELATLKGVGDVRAKAIVKGRPYKGKDELVAKKIVPQGVYDDIKEQIIAKQK